MTTELDDTESELDGLSKEDIEVLSEPAVPVKKTHHATTMPKASDEECEETVKGILAKHPGFVFESKHWSLTLISIICRIGFVPTRQSCANPLKLPAFMPDTDALGIVQLHISSPMLKTIEKRVDKWIEQNDVIVMTDEDGTPVEGEIIVQENGVMAYSDKPAAAIEKSSSETKEDWGSW